MSTTKRSNGVWALFAYFIINSYMKYNKGYIGYTADR